jgi:hypothetical protein
MLHNQRTGQECLHCLVVVGQFSVQPNMLYTSICPSCHDVLSSYPSIVIMQGEMHYKHRHNVHSLYKSLCSTIHVAQQAMLDTTCHHCLCPRIAWVSRCNHTTSAVITTRVFCQYVQLDFGALSTSAVSLRIWLLCHVRWNPWASGRGQTLPGTGTGLHRPMPPQRANRTEFSQ